MNASQRDSIVYSLVVPVYNEEPVIPLLLHRLDLLLHRLDGAAEVIRRPRDSGPARASPHGTPIRMNAIFDNCVARRAARLEP
jgi:hypothetical protein